MNLPIVSAVNVCPVDFTINLSPFFSCPLKILMSDITPRKLSYHESIIKACKFSSSDFLGAGIFCAICCIRSFKFVPSLALTDKASDASMPMISSISFLTLSGSACGRSILLITGITSRPRSIAL